jgi:hypothetical protein
MITVSLALAVAYLLLGFLASSLLRKGRPEDWDESLLASVVALPLFILITAAALAQFAWTHLIGGKSGPAAQA